MMDNEDIVRYLLLTFHALVSLVLSLFFGLINNLMKLAPSSWRRCNVTDKIVLITGAGSGIGRGVAVRLASKGAKIVSWDVNSRGNEETARVIRKEGGKCFIYTVDLCDKNAIYSAAAKVKKEVGKVDILVNNAGIVTGKPFLEGSDEMVHKTFDVNIFSHFWTTKAFLPGMIAENSGHIVTIASLAGLFGANKLIDYCASKFAAVGFDESLRQEIMREGYRGISTTVVCPYYINTGMFDGVKSNLLPLLEQDYVADEITDAILLKTRTLILPRICHVFIIMKSLFADKAYDYCMVATGVGASMDDFTGRKKVKSS